MAVFGNLCFDLPHSGLSNDGKDRLQKKFNFKGIKVIRINGKIYFFYVHIIPAVYQLAVDLAFQENKNNYLLYGFSLLPI